MNYLMPSGKPGSGIWAEELRNDTSRVKEVWARVGYNDASNFTHDFRQRFHVPPIQYRMQALPPIRWWEPGRLDAQGQTTEREGTQRTLLLVDDDIGMRETVGHHLQSVGFRIVATATGREALLEGRRRGFDAGLIDYHLPDMDGIDCMERLVREGTIQPSRFVLFTADCNVDDRIEELNRLGAKLLSKLSDLDEIDTAVRDAVRR